MLVLTRKNKESLYIEVEQDGEKKRIKIQVVSTTGRHVRLGIEAPKEFLIFREELLENAAAV